MSILRAAAWVVLFGCVACGEDSGPGAGAGASGGVGGNVGGAPSGGAAGTGGTSGASGGGAGGNPSGGTAGAAGSSGGASGGGAGAGGSDSLKRYHDASSNVFDRTRSQFVRIRSRSVVQAAKKLSAPTIAICLIIFIAAPRYCPSLSSRLAVIKPLRCRSCDVRDLHKLNGIAESPALVPRRFTAFNTAPL